MKLTPWSATPKVMGNYSPVPGTGCWLWLGSQDRYGYGVVKTGGKWICAAHRLFYQMHKGPIPEGMLVCHTCDTPLCVNPDHLWLGTPKENVQDMIKKGRTSVVNLNRKPDQHKKTARRNCRKCGVEFFARQSVVDKGGAIYCSNACSAQRKVEMNRKEKIIPPESGDRADYVAGQAAHEAAGLQDGGAEYQHDREAPESGGQGDKEPANLGEFVIALLIAGGYVTQAKCDEARKIALSHGPYEMPQQASGAVTEAMVEAACQSYSGEYVRANAVAKGLMQTNMRFAIAAALAQGGGK